MHPRPSINDEPLLMLHCLVQILTALQQLFAVSDDVSRLCHCRDNGIYVGARLLSEDPADF